MAKSIVIIPTFNEIENIEDIIQTVFALPKSFDILVVDDNSPDGTASKVKTLQQQFSNRLFLEIRKKKSLLPEHGKIKQINEKARGKIVPQAPLPIFLMNLTTLL